MLLYNRDNDHAYLRFFLLLSRSRKQVTTINIHTNTRFSFSHVIRMYAGCYTYTYTSLTITTITGIDKWLVSISVCMTLMMMSELLSKCHVRSFFFSVYSDGVQLGCSSVGFDFICLNEYAQTPPFRLELTNMISILPRSIADDVLLSSLSLVLICINKKRQYSSQFH